MNIHFILSDQSDTISLTEYKQLLSRTTEYFNCFNVMRSVSLSGNKIFNIPDIFKYIKYTNKLRYFISLSCREDTISPDILNNLAQINKNIKIQLYLDGPEDIHDIIHGKESYQNICNTINSINQYGLNCNICYRLSKQNYNKIEETYNDILNRAPARYIWFGRTLKNDVNEMLTTKEFSIFIQALRRIQLQYKEKSLSVFPSGPSALQFATNTDLNYRCYHCTAGTEHIVIKPSGNVMLCTDLDFSIGNLFEEDWFDILERAQDTINEIHKTPDECKKCGYATECNGGLKCATYKQYGNFNHKDPNCIYQI